MHHNTTIGVAKSGGGCPIINNGATIGANTVVIGAITIGENATIAAGADVVKDIPLNVIVANNPAKIIKYMKNE